MGALQDLFDSRTVDDTIQGDARKTATMAARYEKVKGIRVHREENLKRIFPPKLERGTAYHFLTAGDIDQLSFPTVILEKLGPFPVFYCSSWTMTRTDVGIIESWADAGMIGAPSFFTGEYFQTRETSAYASLVDMIQRTGGRLRTFRNHAKVTLLGCPERDEWLTLTGSANLSMNPRTEQTVLFNDPEVFNFYRAWFDDLFSTAEPKP